MPGGAFERLAPGEQKIARSLFAAQRRDVPPGSRLTLDQIAAKKSGEGWGGVFKDMKSQGLVTAKNLGQVVSKYNHSTKGVVTTASGRVVSDQTSNATNAKESNGNGHAFGASNNSGGGAAHGSSKGGK